MKYYLAGDVDRNIVFRLTGKKNDMGLSEYEMFSPKFGWHTHQGMALSDKLLATHVELTKKEIVKMKLKGEL